MLILPIANNINWRNLPVVTIWLILAKCIIFCGLQFSDDQRGHKAQQYYFESGPAEIESPGYLDYLKTRRDIPPRVLSPRDIPAHLKPEDYIHYYYERAADYAFLRKLWWNEIISSEQPIIESASSTHQTGPVVEHRPIITLVKILESDGPYCCRTINPDAPQLVIKDYSAYPYIKIGNEYEMDRQFFFDIHEGIWNKDNLKALTDFQQGLYYYVKRNYEKALEIFENLKIKSDLGYYMIAKCHLSSSRFQQATEYYQSSLANTQSNILRSRVYLDLSKIYKNSEQAKELEYLQISIQYDQRNYPALQRLGFYYWQQFLRDQMEINWSKSVYYFRKIDKLEFMKDRSIYLSRVYNNILKYWLDYSDIYSEFTVENVVSFIKDKPLRIQLSTIMALWHSRIQYLPDRDYFNSLEYTVNNNYKGDCDDYAIYVYSILERLNIDNKILIKRITINLLDAFVIVPIPEENKFFVLQVENYLKTKDFDALGEIVYEVKIDSEGNARLIAFP